MRSTSSLRLLPSALLLCAASSCLPLRYLRQAAVGQAELRFGGESLEAAMVDPAIPGRVRRVLREVPKIRAFGERMGLTPTGNYRRYVDLGRPAVVWVVSGCEELAFRSRGWWFPIVGEVPYLGFFDPEGALELAHDLRKEGLDVDVRTARAYSTLGWFEDPLLSTMIPGDDTALGELANTFLHESTHATVYVANQTAFNETVASWVGDHLAPLWLTEARGVDGVETRAYLTAERDHAQRIAAMQRTHDALAALYASELPKIEKRTRKATLIGSLKAELGLSPNRTINNATLAELRNYHGDTAALDRLFVSCGKSWPATLAALQRIEGDWFDKKGQFEFAPVLDRARCGGAG